MNKIKFNIYLVAVVILLSGCADYRYQISSKDLGRGYVRSRNSFVIPEYTIGKGGKAPQDKQIAAARFKRRRHVVDYYYKQMGYLFHEPMQFMRLFGQSFGTPFKLPGIVVDQHRYKTDKEYRERIDKQQDELEAKEEARIAAWQAKLDEYIQKDLEKEQPTIDASQEKK